MQPIPSRSTTAAAPSKNPSKPLPRIPPPQIPRENKTTLTNKITVFKDLSSFYIDWLKHVTEATPHLNKFIRLEQLLLILKTEKEILNDSEDVVACAKNIACDPTLVSAASPLLSFIQNQSEKSLTHTMIELARNQNDQREFFLERLHEDCYPPYSPVIFPTFDKLLSTINCSNRNELKRLFRHDNFSTFLRCLLPLIKSYKFPDRSQTRLFAGPYMHKLQSLLYTPEDSLDKVKKHIRLHMLYLASQSSGPTCFEDMSCCNNDCTKRIAPIANNLPALEKVETYLIKETQYMEEMRQKQHGLVENYAEYQRLMQLKYCDAYDLPVLENNGVTHAYPLDKDSWEEAQENPIVKKIHLDNIKLETEVVASCKKKGLLYFIYMKTPRHEEILHCLRLFPICKGTLKNPLLIEVYQKFIATLELSEIAYSQRLYLDLSHWLQSIPIIDPSIDLKLIPFLERLNGFIHQLSKHTQRKAADEPSAIPLLFSLVFQYYFDMALEQWSIYQQSQYALLECVKNQKQALLPKPPTTSKKAKKKKQPVLAPVPPVEAEPKKKSRIQKTAETIKQTVKAVKQLPTLTKKPVVTPNLAAQALQQQLSKKTASVTAPKVNRIQNWPGIKPKFPKLERVTKWEEISANSKEELKQCVYHIPHPLVDRYVHLGIEGVREGSACISIPAEITFDDEKPIQGTIGYTFSADGVCFHRHFTANTSEPQKKEASAYAHYPTLSSAYAPSYQSWFIKEYQCQVIEDAAGNVTFKHTQTATCGEQTIHVPVTIKIFNTK